MSRRLTGLDLAFGGLGFLLGRASVAGLLDPFGVAFVAAVTVVRPRSALFAATCAFLGSLAGQTWARALEVAIILFLLGPALTAVRAGAAQLRRRGVVTALSVFGLSLFVREAVTVITSPDSFALLTAGFDAVLSAVLAVIFTPAVDFLQAGRPETIDRDQLVFVGIMTAAAAAGLSGIKLGPYAVDGMVAAYLVMALASRGGLGLGAAAGVLVGLVGGLRTGLAASSIGLEGLAGLLAGMFSGLGKVGVIAGYLLARAVLGAGLGLVEDLPLLLIPAAAGAILFAMTPSATLTRLLGPVEESDGGPGRRLDSASPIEALSFGATDEDADGPPIESQYAGPNAETVGRLVGLFNDLAGAIQEVAAAGPSREDPLPAYFESVSTQVCERCSLYGPCWKDNLRDTYRRLMDLWNKAEAAGGLTIEDYPKGGRRCSKVGEVVLAADFCHRAERLRRSTRERLRYSRLAMADQCKGVASILAEAAAKDGRNGQVERRLAQSVRRALARAPGPSQEVEVRVGGGRPVVSIRSRPCETGDLCRGTLAPLISEAVGTEVVPLWPDCADQARRPSCTQVFRSHLPLGCAVAVASRSKDGQAVSGDSYLAKELDDGHMVLALSDGMGAGAGAARESRTAVALLERLLESGFGVDAAVRTINSVLLLRTPEDTFATIDLAVIDLATGDCDFTKIGACPSYLRRGERVAAIRASSVPAGILGEIDVEPEHWRLRPGDTLIMATDGALVKGDKVTGREADLVRRFKAVGDGPPQGVAASLMESVGETGALCDDLTILCARIESR
ncbi:MAG TPA: SpoIIE family protein phosphatase [Bacillota bacterium]